MKNIKEIIKIGLILFAITAISALLLAFANKTTAPLIAMNNQKKTEASMKVVFKDADSFEKADIQADKVEEAYIAKDSSGEKIGVCIVSTDNGYGGEIKVMTGVDTDGKITGVDILSHSETPGLGANAANPEFKDQFSGKTAPVEAVKGEAGDSEVSAMSGATITSKAVVRAVNTASEAAKSILKEG